MEITMLTVAAGMKRLVNPSERSDATRNSDCVSRTGMMAACMTLYRSTPGRNDLLDHHLVSFSPLSSRFVVDRNRIRSLSRNTFCLGPD
jgi:hypothetical protein